MTPLEAYNLEQGSEDWVQARVGLVTASRCFEAFATTTKGVYTAKHEDYRSELICERLTGQPYPKFVSAEMRWGREQEPFARAAYELQRDALVETCGFVLHPEIERFGASPDGLVGEDGLIQIKCPTTSTHIDWIRHGTVPVEHCPQMLAEMSCTGRLWCDLVSYDPRLPEHLQLWIVRFERNDDLIAKLERNVRHFNRELDEVLAALPQGPQRIAELLEWPREDEVEF